MKGVLASTRGSHGCRHSTAIGEEKAQNGGGQRSRHQCQQHEHTCFVPSERQHPYALNRMKKGRPVADRHLWKMNVIVFRESKRILQPTDSHIVRDQKSGNEMTGFIRMRRKVTDVGSRFVLHANHRTERANETRQNRSQRANGFQSTS